MPECKRRGGFKTLECESLSAYARQFLEQMEKPDVDSSSGDSGGDVGRRYYTNSALTPIHTRFVQLSGHDKDAFIREFWKRRS